MERAGRRAYIRHRVPAPGPVGTNYAAFNSFSTAETELPTFFTRGLQLILRNSYLLGPVAKLVVLAGIDAGAVPHSLFGPVIG